MDIALDPDPQDRARRDPTRSRAFKPEVLLASDGWRTLRDLRDLPPAEAATAVGTAFADLTQDARAASAARSEQRLRARSRRLAPRARREAPEALRRASGPPRPRPPAA